MQEYWIARAVPSATFSVLDLESTSLTGDPYGSLKGQFALAKQLVAAAAVVQGATDGGASAVSDAYDATLVPPFCFFAVRSFFAAQ
jgi:hypothetical protein